MKKVALFLSVLILGQVSFAKDAKRAPSNYLMSAYEEGDLSKIAVDLVKARFMLEEKSTQGQPDDLKYSYEIVSSKKINSKTYQATVKASANPDWSKCFDVKVYEDYAFNASPRACK